MGIMMAWNPERGGGEGVTRYDGSSWLPDRLVWNQLKGTPLGRACRHFQKGFTEGKPLSQGRQRLPGGNTNIKRCKERAGLSPASSSCCWMCLSTDDAADNPGWHPTPDSWALRQTEDQWLPRSLPGLHQHIKTAEMFSHTGRAATGVSASSERRHLCWTAQTFRVSWSNISSFIIDVHPRGFILLENPT